MPSLMSHRNGVRRFLCVLVISTVALGALFAAVASATPALVGARISIFGGATQSFPPLSRSISTMGGPPSQTRTTASVCGRSRSRWMVSP